MHLQSSANLRGEDSKTDKGRLFTYVMNSSVPRILLCGTPDVT